MQAKKTILLWLLLTGLFLLIWRATMEANRNEQTEVGVGEIVRLAETGEVKSVVIEGNSVTLTPGATSASHVRYVAIADSAKPELIRILVERHIPFEERVPSQFMPMVISMLPWVVLAIVLVFFMSSIGSQSRNASAQIKSKSKMAENVATRFSDVAGVDEAVEEVRDLVSFLKRPKDFGRLGGRVPKGVLLAGPPGTGKTLLARAVAGEAGVPFISGSASEFVEMFVGVGASRVRDLFAEARRHAPAIIFIDEIDAVGRKRGGVSSGSHEERQQTLNQILVEMYGFAENSGVIVLAATNQPEVLDGALLRAGRFDRRVYMPLPDVRGREAILKVHAKNKKFDDTVDLTILARGTAGMTGADLEMLLNEAALYAAKLGHPAISGSDLEYARDKVIAGPERKSSLLTPRIKSVVAYHEAGHAVTAWFTKNCDPVYKVSVVPRGSSLGHTQILPQGDRPLKSRNQLLDELVCLFGGRAAEKKVASGDFTTGASDDIERATAIARRMVTDWGMAENLGQRTFGEKEHGIVFENERRDYSDATADLIDKEIRRILDQAFGRTENVLTEHWDRVVALAEALLAEETVDGARLVQLLGERPE